MYVLKRIGQGVLTFVSALTIAFMLFRMLPNDPVTALASTRYRECVESSGAASCDYIRILERVQQRINIDLTEPIPVAYLDYIGNIVLYQDFGTSFTYGEPVFELLFKAMPWSIFISLFGLALGWSFNIFWGTLLAYNEGERFDKFGTLFALTGNAIPYYVAAIIALMYFGFIWELFPTAGRWSEEFALVVPLLGEVWHPTNIQPGYNPGFVVSVIWHGILPIFTGFVLGISGLAMRGNAIRVMGSDYLRVARLRGLSSTRIAQRYVTRNAILPLYTGFMIGIAGIFSSGIIMERIFTYPAVGFYTFDALNTRDYPLLLGSFLFYTALTIIGITIADLSYQFVDPRAGGDNEAY
jgi:peptide/nickel transport system permease protein